MGTISGQVRLAFEDAECVPLERAQPGGVPGWYGLQLGLAGALLSIGETADLAARVAHHRRQLQQRGHVGDAGVWVRWVEAHLYLGARASERAARAAIENVLTQLYQPEWVIDRAGVSLALDAEALDAALAAPLRLAAQEPVSRPAERVRIGMRFYRPPGA